MTTLHWQPPPRRLLLAPGDVDVWCADLSCAGDDERTLLSPDERGRAERFVRERDGRRWAAAHGILRLLLARYLDADPRALAFAPGPHGKPALAGGAERLRFNLSHSGDLALYAVALDREVGIDVELPRRPLDAIALARRTFGPAEAARLEALPASEREPEFLRAWVRWEATLKCHGTGIGGEEESAGAPAPWLHELALPAPAVAALAVEGGACEVRCFAWPTGGG